MTPKTISPIQSKKRILPLLLGIVVFGVLMGIRDDFPHPWQRILAAAVASGIFAASITAYRK
jgi:hypothetical protein